ncbi:MAG: membrane protein insertase YidC [Alphaproteobacteria bacterium]|nr:membrane protein insertase YidC [Alphaproteobacteria bacterium]
MTAPAAQGPEFKNLVIAIIAATAIMIGWQHFYERPRLAAMQAQQASVEARTQREAARPPAFVAQPAAAQNAGDAPRIRINTPALHGSFSVVGNRFDDLTLASYHEENVAGSPEVTLLKRAGEKEAYFIELGMLAHETEVRLPDAATRWQTSDRELGVGKPVTLTWSNGAGLQFTRTIAVDEHFMFTVTTRVQNNGSSAVTLYPYGLVSRNYDDAAPHFAFMHEGPLGAVNGVLEDVSYKDLREDGAKKFTDTQGWVGMTDKYWLTALIPDGQEKFDAEFKHFARGQADAYQADLRGQALEVPVGQSVSTRTRIFAGAKVVGQLDRYREEFNIPLFDRAVDFGSLYFLTRPIFSLLTYFHGIVGNFGVAILLLTFCIKLALFPLASKSMTSMSRMKQLTPKMTELRERHKDDKMRLNQEIMALYKREKVNPVSGCLPILLQIPIFLALYRVLFVTIEMRHAPFFGWVTDLSAVDPTNLFTLFGLLPWAVPSFLHLGVWPLVMCATMVIQQRLNPKPADPIQAAMMNYMPFIFLFMFAGFPAGLVIYWVCNNTLSILQQLYINTRLTKKGLR